MVFFNTKSLRSLSQQDSEVCTQHGSLERCSHCQLKEPWTLVPLCTDCNQTCAVWLLECYPLVFFSFVHFATFPFWKMLIELIREKWEFPPISSRTEAAEPRESLISHDLSIILFCFFLPDFHRILRWRRPRYHHCRPGKRPHRKTNCLRLSRNVRRIGALTQIGHYTSRFEGWKCSTYLSGMYIF